MPKKLTYENVKQYVESKNVELISTEYINQDSKLKFKCSCGNIYNTTYAIFKRNKKHQCDKCGLKIKINKFIKTTEQFKKEIKDIDDNFDITEEYKGAKIPITFIFKPTGKTFKCSPTNFIKGDRGYCYGLSKNENCIEKYLKLNNINFEPQYKFEDCRYKTYLRFDFALFDKCNNLKCLIEYDGEQHYMPVKFNNISIETAEKILVQTQIKDNIKNIYCKENNIKLIRIPYWEANNIDNILNDIVSSI